MKKMDYEYIIILIKVNMKGNGKTMKGMGLVYFIILMEINLKESGKMAKEKVME